MSDHTKHPALSTKPQAKAGVTDCQVDAAVRILEACGRAPGLFERLSPELSAAVNATLLAHLNPPPTT